MAELQLVRAAAHRHARPAASQRSPPASSAARSKRRMGARAQLLAEHACRCSSSGHLPVCSPVLP